MIHIDVRQRMNRPPKRFVIRSVVATVIGWLVPSAILYLLPMGGTLVSGPTGSPTADSILAPFILFLWFSGIMGMWIFPVWLLAVLPMTLFVPEGSKLWHPLVIGPVGLVAGGVILIGSILLLSGGSGEVNMNSLYPMAGIACTVGLLTGLALAYLFRRKKPNQTIEGQPIQPLRD